MMKFRDVFEKLLDNNTGEETLKETIAKSITEKASNGDINAVKFLRDLVDDQDDNPIPEIKITIVE